MSELTESLVRIHRIVTRGLNIARTEGEKVVVTGFPEPTKRKGYLDYSRCLVMLLRSHHEGEEAIMFPKFAGLSAVVNTLEQQHRQLVTALDQATAAIVTGETGETSLTWLKDFVNALKAIEPLWADHISLEESTFTEAAIDAVIPREAQGALVKTLAEHGVKHGHIAPISIAFLLYNLAGEDRESFKKVLPPQLVNELVPGPWRAQWAPMDPFLLQWAHDAK